MVAGNRVNSHAAFQTVAYHASKARKELAYLGIRSANSGSHGDRSNEGISEDALKEYPKISVDWEEKKGWVFVKKERTEPNVRAQSSAGDTEAGHRYLEVALKSG